MNRTIRLVNRNEITVTIVDSDRLFSECLAAALCELGLSVIGILSEWEDAFERIRSEPPIIALIDFGLGAEKAFDLTRSITAGIDGVKVIILGVMETERLILSSIEAGARGYVGRGESLSKLVATIESVFCGETICSPHIAFSSFSRVAELSRQERARQLHAESDLTAREIEILQLIAEGLSNKEIADRIFLSTHTVKNHVHRLLEKLRVENRLAAANVAMHIGLGRWGGQ